MINKFIPSISSHYLICLAGGVVVVSLLTLTTESASAATIAANSALGSTLTYNFSGTAFNGSTPSSTGSYLTAVFKSVDANTIDLTLTSSLETTAEYIQDVAFNFNPSKSLANLSIAQTNTSGATTPLITGIGKTTQDAQNLSGAGNTGKKFDINFSWTSAHNSGRFNAFDTNTFRFTLSTGLDLADFGNYVNSGTGGGYPAGIHIAGIGTAASGAVSSSAPILAAPPTVTPPTVTPPTGTAVPEPFTILGSATALGLGASFKRRLAKATKG